MVELIVPERGAGERAGGRQVLFSGPCQEPLERPVMGVEGPLRVGARGEVFEESRGAGRQTVGCGEDLGSVANGANLTVARDAGYSAVSCTMRRSKSPPEGGTTNAWIRRPW